MCWGSSIAATVHGLYGGSSVHAICAHSQVPNSCFDNKSEAEISPDKAKSLFCVLFRALGDLIV